MAELMELLNERRGNTSYEKFAVQELGVSGSTLWRYDQRGAAIGMDVLKKMAQKFTKDKDTLMLGAITAYALGLKVDIPQLERIGACLLEVEQVPS